MVKLWCAIVRRLGETKPGSVFEVEIDDANSVDALRNAIAEKQKCTFPASDLQLYLAKRKVKKTEEQDEKEEERDDEEEEKAEERDDKEEEKAEEKKEEEEWLTQREVLDGVSDMSDYKHLQFTEAELRDVGLDSGEVVEVSRAEKAAGMGPVHVLAVAPKDAMREVASFAVKEVKVAMNEVLDERDERFSVYSISACTVSKQEKLVRKLGYQYRTIDVMEEINHSIKPYPWQANLAEDHEVQRRGYIQYLKDNLPSVLHQDGSTATQARTSPRLKPKFYLEDTSQNNTLLNCNDSSSLPFGVTGTADLMIIDEAAKAMDEVFAGLHFVIELKKDHCGGKERFQILLELVAADLKSESRCAPIGLLTNLNNYWYFLWFTPSRTIARLTLKCPANGFRMMKELLSGTTDTSTAEFPMRIRFLSLPVLKRQKLLKAAPLGDDAATEMMERYELMSDEVSPEFLLARRMEYEFQKVREMPIHSGMYT